MRDVAADAHRQAIGHAAALREFSGTDWQAQMLGLLEALKTRYMHDLVSVSPEELQLKQGALRQVMALQMALSGDGPSDPLV
mgnify:CR=1 FL=1